MPFQGIWKLLCQGCGKDFTVELKPGDQLVEFAKSYACPHCKNKPDEHVTSDKALGSWHHVIDFDPKPA